MQTMCYTTSNFIRHTGNVVDLGEYRRKLEQAAQPEPEFYDLPCRPLRRDSEEYACPVREQRPAPRRARSAARRALRLPDLCTTLSVLVMTLSFTLRVLVL